MTPPHDGGTEPPAPAPARPARSDAPAARRQFERYVWALFVLWAAVVGASLAWNIVGVNREARRVAQLAVRVAPEAEGTSRGAPAVSFLREPLWALARRQRTTLLLGHGLIFFVGLLGLTGPESEPPGPAGQV